MRRLGIRVLSLVIVLFLATSNVHAAATEAGPSVLAGVKWFGQGAADVDEFRGKVVVVLSYVTWCPLCNEWSPEMLSQLKQTAAENPVVVLAIATETPTVSAAEYMTPKQFIAPNILHGQDEKINEKLGLEKANLFNYVIYDTKGNVARMGSAGSYSNGPTKEYTVAREAARLASEVKFEALAKDMPPAVRDSLWPLELGRPMNETMLKRLRSQFNGKDAEAFDAAVTRYVQSRVARIGELSKGGTPEQIEAYRLTDNLLKNFRSREEIEPLKDQMQNWTKDAVFKRELAAGQAYDLAMAQIRTSPARKAALLSGVANRFKDTHYGSLAAEQAAAP